MRKIAIFAFKGEIFCFIHVLLNAIHLHENGYTSKIIIEGEATKLPKVLEDKTHFMHELYLKAKNLNIIDKVCKACSSKMGVLDDNIKFKLPLGDDLNGHPSFLKYIQDGYEIIVM